MILLADVNCRKTASSSIVDATSAHGQHRSTQNASTDNVFAAEQAGMSALIHVLAIASSCRV